jgi:hypothetical protein
MSCALAEIFLKNLKGSKQQRVRQNRCRMNVVARLEALIQGLNRFAILVEAEQWSTTGLWCVFWGLE